MAIIKTKFDRGVEGATNIVDSGTEGTKVASGTSAQRGSTQGQLRFNTTTGLAEYYTGTAFKSIDSPPTVSSIDVTEVDSQAGGNQTIVITGSGFNSGATVTFVGNSGTDFNASTVTRNSDTQITAVAPKASFLNAQEPYGVKVTNVSGLSATLASQINVDSSPSWSTASGTLFTIQDNATGTHATVSASDPDGDTVAYTETASVLSGQNLAINSSTGAITGDPTDVNSATTLNFDLRATAGGKNTTRNFNAIINPSPLALTYLIIAGGGAGGSAHTGGAGGGAGGMLSGTTSLTSGINYTVTVGAGATASIGSGDTNGANGNNSVLSGSGLTTVTAIGGGGGGAWNTDTSGGNGGSGGGSEYSGNPAGSGTSGQGNNGGNGDGAPQYGAGGGGGAGSAGSAGSTSSGGNGGAGSSNSITGSAVTYAGGGGGGTYAGGTNGTGGAGGGGNAGSAGTNNLGGGGGGSIGVQNNTTLGGNGGSGVVIFSYPSSKTLTIGAGLTSSTATVGNNKVTSFTAGTGTISF
tara:strand:+ start:7 stop:1578 length:1572 start_codon:yes stop_codon:yes gene_type:complete